MKQINEPDPNSVEEDVLSLASSSPFSTGLCKEVESPVCYSKNLQQDFFPNAHPGLPIEASGHLSGNQWTVTASYTDVSLALD